ncbi:unnamed protein product (macronuclear) [Paramecium tetraurelia]|uniref:Uncharacterized protein n=1 Tax=Paramecium tetraurelia TaxID=5888 RepID=A0BRY3_PARTE|nr:uncharacterized protein GSPATT00031531001 [Paramecium tetraurelia]CAK61300.1 unnamed protein product [Paramecium tetraurelia]|eukprot:XP_001428698.1 hypothetical protein (macronuclear) [Paramecium tetraurelia strain d4-2]
MGCVNSNSHYKKNKDLDIANVPIMLNNQKTLNIEKIQDNWLEMKNNSILARRHQQSKLSIKVTTNSKSPLSCVSRN